MWMRQQQKIENISIGILPFVQMRMWSTMTTKWIPSWAIGVNANVLSNQKSLHTHDCRRVANTLHRGKLHWSFNILGHSYSSSYSHYGHWNLSYRLVSGRPQHLDTNHILYPLFIRCTIINRMSTASGHRPYSLSDITLVCSKSVSGCLQCIRIWSPLLIWYVICLYAIYTHIPRHHRSECLSSIDLVQSVYIKIKIAPSIIPLFINY